MPIGGIAACASPMACSDSLSGACTAAASHALLLSEIQIRPAHASEQSQTIGCRTSVKHRDKVTDPMVKGRICATNSVKMRQCAASLGSYACTYPVR